MVVNLSLLYAFRISNTGTQIEICTCYSLLLQAVITLFSDWEFKEAILIRQLDNGTVVQTGDEGLLYVTLVNQQTREERRGTVCHNKFNTQAARLFCQNMGYEVEEGVWGSHPDYNYVSK